MNDLQLVVGMAGVLSGFAALAGVVILRNQLRHAQRDLYGNTSRFCYEEMSALLGVLIEHPHLRPYVYGDEALPADGVVRHQALALSARYADFFEAILTQHALGNLSLVEFNDVWDPFIAGMLDRSAAITNYISEHADWYSTVLVSRLSTSLA